MAGQRDTGAGPDAEPRPLTYVAASARYTDTKAAYERFTELRTREASVLSETPSCPRAASRLRWPSTWR
jgi:hypothetical protein